MYLLINKQTPYTRNPKAELDCSRHGSLAQEQLSFMVNNKLPKAYLITFGMQLTRLAVLRKEYLIRPSKEATGHDKSWNEATYESIDWRHHGE
jgi:hypothetical protein